MHVLFVTMHMLLILDLKWEQQFWDVRARYIPDAM